MEKSKQGRISAFVQGIADRDPVKLELSFAVSLLDRLYAVLLFCMPSERIRQLAGRDRARVFVELYLWLYTTALVSIWCIFSVSDLKNATVPWKIGLAFIVGVRMVEMLLFSIELLTGKFKADPINGAVVFVAYLIQVLVCATLLAEALGTFTAESFSTPTHTISPTSRGEYLFMIWGFITTIGPGYSPHGTGSLALSMLTGTYSFLLLGVFLAYVMDRVGTGDGVAAAPVAAAAPAAGTGAGGAGK